RAVKIEAVAHLMANIFWLLGMVAILTLYPAILWRVGIGLQQIISIDLPLFLVSTGAIMSYFLLYSIISKSRKLRYVFLLPALTIGLAPSISLSVLLGMFQSGGAFERTPKFGMQERERMPVMAFLYHQKNLPYVFLNGVLLIYCMLPIIFSWQRGTWPALALLLLVPFGFALAMTKDIRESLYKGRAK
ncbi:MAG: glycosyl transferase family 2, partial [Candidatus Omnitrophota bacterium]